MGIRTFFARILVAMALTFVVATLIVVSVNYQSRQGYSALAEAQSQSIQWQEAREAVIQLTELGEPIPDGRSVMLASLPLPFACCESERSLVLRSLESVGSGIAADRYRASAAWEQMILAQRLRLTEARRDLAADVAIRNWMIPAFAGLVLAMVLLISWAILKTRLITPTEKLSHYADKLLRGRQSQALNMEGVPRELQGLYETFDLTIGDYRGQLNSRRERALEMSSESDLLEMQIQSLVEQSERPAFVLDVSGAVRTWNRRMISLSGVSKTQALREVFAGEYLDDKSREIFDLAMQTARLGKLPEEFGCMLLLRGAREVPVTLQLSPQVEPGLGVNRVVCLVGVEEDDDQGRLPDGLRQVDQAPNALMDYIRSLTKHVHGMTPSGDSPSLEEFERRQSGLTYTLGWLADTHDADNDGPIDATELIAHIASLIAQRCQELDIVFDTNLKAAEALSEVRAGTLMDSLNAIFTNAIEAIVKKGSGEREVILTTESTGSHLIVQVSDSGTGLTDYALGHAFDPFYTTKVDERALGLGLTHTKYAVELAGGSVSITALPKREGTLVTLRLPLSVAS